MVPSKVSINVSIGLGVLGAATCWAVWKYMKMERIPTKWRKVGTLTDLMCFPVKSGGVLRSSEMECTDLGLKLGLARDRYFLVANSEGNFVSARVYPKLVLIKPRLDEHNLILEAPNMTPLKLNLKEQHEDNKIDTTLWGKSIKSIDSGDEAAKWLSRYLCGEDSGFRLVHFPQDYKNISRTRDKAIVGDIDSGAYPDLTSYCIINGSSVDDLNSRLKEPVSVQQFRPNFVVSGPQPLEEDYWEWVQIGDVVFKAVKQCNRCQLTTVNIETGVKHPTQEPITTLKTYRLIGDPKLKTSDKSSPVMGVHLALRKAGNVKLGDPIFVA